MTEFQKGNYTAFWNYLEGSLTLDDVWPTMEEIRVLVQPSLLDPSDR